MITIRIPARALVTALHATAATLMLAFLVTQALKLHGYDSEMGFRRLFNLDAEGTLPVWFSSAVMLGASALLAAIAAERSRAGDRYRWHWWVLSIGLLFMSADETASIHEMTNRAAAALPITAKGFLLFPWVVIGGAVVLVVGLSYLRFLRDLPPAARRGFIVAAACYLGGALGMEMVSAAVASAQGLDLQPIGWDERGDFTFAYALVVAAEEGLEMVGMNLFVEALLDYLATQIGGIGVEVGR